MSGSDWPDGYAAGREAGIREGRRQVMDSKWAVCVSNKGFEAALELRKIYRVLVDNTAENLIRIVDESGEDYLYLAEMFELIQPSREQRIRDRINTLEAELGHLHDMLDREIELIYDENELGLTDTCLADTEEHPCHE